MAGARLSMATLILATAACGGESNPSDNTPADAAPSPPVDAGVQDATSPPDRDVHTSPPIDATAIDAPARPKGYVHAHGATLLDGTDRHLPLRTAALGNWLLNEGYMWLFDGDRGDRSRRIEQRIVEMIGAQDATAFWKGYRDSFVTEDDMARVAVLGFNSVRVAMNARLLMPEGQDSFDENEFVYLSRVADWGARHDVYVIFDMHAAPGGQTGHNIDDDANNSPDLFTDPANQDRLVKLWTEIARRFSEDGIVAGYDLLNEPLPGDFARYNDQLWPLLQRVGHAIRAVDPNHLLIVEGANWANDWSTLGAPFDDNMAYSFHKYWNNSDISSIQGYLDYRNQWQRPVWCGETGENDDGWYRANIQLLEDNDVGWCFWTWKKMESGNNPYSVPAPNGWGAIQSYVADANAQKPSHDAAKATLDELLKNIQLAQCKFNQDVLCSLPPLVSKQTSCQ